MNSRSYDIVVIGGGHAGSEAAWAASSLGYHVALISMRVSAIGRMSCNPAIGGLAKGQMVREIDALGGIMGRAIDATGIQFRLLNRSKGPAVRGPRAQADKYRYQEEIQRLIGTRSNIDIFQGMVEDIEVQDGKVTGVVAQLNLLQLEDEQSQARAQVVTDLSGLVRLKTKVAILTTGTFMRGLMHTGEAKEEGGRKGEVAAVGISGNLRRLGFDLGRLKTGTCPRLDAETINWDVLQEQPGDEIPEPFSDLSPQIMPTGRFPNIQQISCYLTYTHPGIHEKIRENLHRAPMFNGQIKDTQGPRYCPSIEDKVVRFADKEQHQIFLEPEGLNTNEVYCNGISTSLPADVQDFIVSRMEGCQNARILKYGYAVEYDMVWPHQIDATGMTKLVEGLFLAGQINGTSGYEEAGGQGLMAGLNAGRWLADEDMVRLKRDQAYIGVLMDDLVTKVPREPYRMFSSRAEHRLLLRSDNSAERLTPLGRELGLVDDERWAWFETRRSGSETLRDVLRTEREGEHNLERWMRRPDKDEAALLEELTRRGIELPEASTERRNLMSVVSDIKYESFIMRHQKQWEKLSRLEDHRLPVSFNYEDVKGMRNEAVLTLNKFRPSTLGQAGRLAGITPADLTVLAIAVGRG